MQEADEQRWVFDRPLTRDPLFVLGLVLGISSIVVSLANWHDTGVVALAFTVLFSVPSALLLIGILLGSIREYLRARAR